MSYFAFPDRYRVANLKVMSSNFRILSAEEGIAGVHVSRVLVALFTNWQQVIKTFAA